MPPHHILSVFKTINFEDKRRIQTPIPSGNLPQNQVTETTQKKKEKQRQSRPRSLPDRLQVTEEAATTTILSAASVVSVGLRSNRRNLNICQIGQLTG